MIAGTVHDCRPERRGDVQEQPRYQLYRDDLRKDFNGACGYCGDSDAYVDRIAFHIDHFAPKDPFPKLANNYSNLVYSCRFCNIRKSNKWVGDDPFTSHNGKEGFIDPCLEEYDEHLERDSLGRIIAKSDVGKYMISNLNLSLVRHSLLWRARKLRRLRERLNELRERFPKGSDAWSDIMESYGEVVEEYDKLERIAAGVK